MKLNVHKSSQRGHTELSWLDSKHSFSFGSYYDPHRLNFGKLIVFNDDVIAAGKGFGMHHHDNAEVVTIVLDGSIAHQDSEGNEGILRTGDVQRMSAGTGILHSEMNPSIDRPAHIIQLWIEPKTKDAKPSYEQKSLSFETIKNNFLSVVSPVKKENSLSINQDAYLFLGNFNTSEVEYQLQSKNHGIFIFMLSGKLEISNVPLFKGDCAEITQTDKVKFNIKEKSQFILIDLPL